MSSTQLKLSTDFISRTVVRGQPEFDLPPPCLLTERMARGRRLAIDPDYPSAKIILIVGRHLVNLSQ